MSRSRGAKFCAADEVRAARFSRSARFSKYEAFAARCRARIDARKKEEEGGRS